ncbi:MAG: M60 family peptidase N-terminal accessory domain-containing protein [Christensenellales bacterium]
MKKKRIFTVLSVVLALCVGLVFLCGCKAEEQRLVYNDKVEGRYADGISIVNTVNAPDYAVEYQGKARVEQLMYVDNTVKGLHLTGLYLPAGETISITVSAEVAQKSHKIVINSLTGGQEVVELDSVRTQYTSPTGGRVDIKVDGAVEERNVFEVKISGCVRMPFYRLGVDNDKPQSQDKGWATLDCGNMRFVFPADMLDDINQLDKSLTWWRSAVEAMCMMTGTKFIDGDLSPIIVYVAPEFENSYREWNKSEKYIKISRSAFEGMIDYDCLKTGGAKSLLDILGEMMADGADGYNQGPLAGKLGKVLSNLTYIIMTDNVKDGEYNGIANSYNQLSAVVNGESIESSNIEVFFDGLLHSFGVEKTINALEQYKFTMTQSYEGDKWSKYIEEVSKSCRDGDESKLLFGADLSYYCQWLDMDVSDECKAAIADLPLYVPVQSTYAVGGGESCQTGISLELGQKTVLDFASSLVSPISGWKVESVEGNGWKPTESGKYEYTPSADRLVDEYKVNLTNGELKTTLYGRVTVNVQVASYSVYRDTQYRDVDKAIKGTAGMTPSFAESISKAEVPEESEADESKYSFGVTKGSMQVNESGKYVFYLKSKGLVKVNFGVSEFMFEMFNNYLTVSDYTQELKYEVQLDKDKVYNYEIYVLSTQGGGWATIGIENSTGKIEDLGEKYIVFSNMSADDVVNYDSPVIDIQDIDLHQQVYADYLATRWLVIDAPETKETSANIYLFDDNNATYFEAQQQSDEYVICFDMQSVREIEYLSVGVKTDMLGATVEIETGNDTDNMTVSADGVLTTIDNVFELTESVNCRYVRLTIKKNENFECAISGISVGRIMSESRIVPNTSTDILYQGEWVNINKYSAVNGSLASNADKNCALEYEFYGSMISVYATKDASFGHAKVYIDGKEHSIIDLSSDVARCGERVFLQEFDGMGLHTIKIVPVDDDKINIDYLTVIEGERPAQQAPKFNYWLMSIIPAVALVGFIAALIADKVSKNKKKQKRMK